jgi:hypothetical protein
MDLLRVNGHAGVVFVLGAYIRVYVKDAMVFTRPLFLKIPTFGAG